MNEQNRAIMHSTHGIVAVVRASIVLTPLPKAQSAKQNTRQINPLQAYIMHNFGSDRSETRSGTAIFVTPKDRTATQKEATAEV